MVKQPAASIPSAGGGWEVVAAATRAVPGGNWGNNSARQAQVSRVDARLVAWTVGSLNLG